MNWPMRAALRHPRSDGRLPWWYPPQRPDARGATVLGLLATLSLVVGYHGTLLSRTMTFAADEFGAGSAAQGDALAAARIGGVLAVALGALADRRGRRLILSLSLFTCIGATVAGAFAPDLAALAGTQAVNRGAWAAAALLLAVIAAEEMPAGARGLRAQPAVDDRRLGGRHRAVGPAGRRPRRTRLARAVPGAVGVRAGRDPVRPADPREQAVRPLPSQRAAGRPLSPAPARRRDVVPPQHLRGPAVAVPHRVPARRTRHERAHDLGVRRAHLHAGEHRDRGRWAAGRHAWPAGGRRRRRQRRNGARRPVVRVRRPRHVDHRAPRRHRLGRPRARRSPSTGPSCSRRRCAAGPTASSA